jgi:hypothetical protein
MFSEVETSNYVPNTIIRLVLEHFIYTNMFVLFAFDGKNFGHFVTLYIQWNNFALCVKAQTKKKTTHNPTEQTFKNTV